MPGCHTQLYIRFSALSAHKLDLRKEKKRNCSFIFKALSFSVRLLLSSCDFACALIGRKFLSWRLRLVRRLFIPFLASLASFVRLTFFSSILDQYLSFFCCFIVSLIKEMYKLIIARKKPGGCTLSSDLTDVKEFFEGNRLCDV